MAIYHLATQAVTRASGHSAVAAAAYRSASKLVDQRTGEIHDFTRKSGVLSAEIVFPEGAASQDRGSLWNACELAEIRKDARTAREWRIALPHELSPDERKAVAHRFAQHVADRYGVAVDVCIHVPDKNGDDRNFHAHMLATTRVVGIDGKLGAKSSIELANKDRQKAGIVGTTQDDIRELRREWAELANAALEHAGRAERIDDRSYEDQGVTLTPTRHVGGDAVAMDRRGAQSERIELHNIDRQEQARQIVDRPELILDKLTATKAVFDRRDIGAELNRYIDDPAQFQDLLVKIEASTQLIEMEPADGRRPARYSTHDMVDAERRMADTAGRLSATSSHAVSLTTAQAAIDGVGSLSDEQKSAITHVTKAGALAVVIGDAGTGKSFSMKVASEAWKAAGLNVRGAALAGKAADELQAGSGIESRTLASLEHGWKAGKNRLCSRDVLVIDEAGMVGSRQLGRVLDAAESAGAKVVLLGDHKQLAAIEAGAAFRATIERVGAVEITEVRRQRHAWAREAGKEFARGSVVRGLREYEQRGHVRICSSRDAARKSLAAAFLDANCQGSQIILAHSNSDVLALNEAVRTARKERGNLAGAARFQTTRGEREFAPGDRIVFLQNDRELGVKNGTLGTVERAEDGHVSIRLDGGESREVDAATYSAVDHGYAVTIHKAQGMTVDHAYVLATPSMDRSLAYVGMTRHRESATMFAAVEDFGGVSASDAGLRLPRTLARDRPKVSTLDFANRRGFDGESVVRRWIERGRAKLELLARKAEVAMERAIGRSFRDEARFTMESAKTSPGPTAPASKLHGRKPPEVESSQNGVAVAPADSIKIDGTQVLVGEPAPPRTFEIARRAGDVNTTTGQSPNYKPREPSGKTPQSPEAIAKADEDAHARLLSALKAGIQGRAMRVAAKLEKKNDAALAASRNVALAGPPELRGISGLFSEAKARHAHEMVAWERKTQQLAKRQRSIHRRLKLVAHIAQSPFEVSRLAAKAVRREYPALCERIESRQSEQRRLRSAEIQKQLDQRRQRDTSRGRSR